PRIGACAVLPQVRQRGVGLVDARLDGADRVLAGGQLPARGRERLVQLAPPVLALGLRALEVLGALDQLRAPRLGGGAALAERREALAHALARALLVRLDREQVERHLLVLGRVRALRAQLGLHLRERGLGLLRLGRGRLAPLTRRRELGLHLALARL